MDHVMAGCLLGSCWVTRLAFQPHDAVELTSMSTFAVIGWDKANKLHGVQHPMGSLDKKKEMFLLRVAFLTDFVPFCWSPCCQGTAQCGIHEMKSELYVWLSPLLLALTEIHGGVVIAMFTFLQTRSYFAATSSHVPEQEAMSTICCMHILCDLWMH